MLTSTDNTDNKKTFVDDIDKTVDGDDEVVGPAACSVTFYSDSNYAGPQQDYSTSKSALPVVYRSAQGSCTLSLYADPSFAGTCITVFAGKAPNLLAGISSVKINKSC